MELLTVKWEIPFWKLEKYWHCISNTAHLHVFWEVSHGLYSEVLVQCLHSRENTDSKSRSNIVRNIGRGKSNAGSLCYFKIVPQKPSYNYIGSCFFGNWLKDSLDKFFFNGLLTFSRIKIHEGLHLICRIIGIFKSGFKSTRYIFDNDWRTVSISFALASLFYLCRPEI